MNNTTKTLAAFAGLALCATAANAITIVYEDTFDNDGLGTNTGTGGGMSSFTIYDNSFADTGALVASSNSNAARRTVASSNSAFGLSGGVTIEVHWQGITNKTGYYDFSLTTDQLSSSLTTSSEGIFTTFDGTTDGQGASSRKGFGMAWGSFKDNAGLFSNDGLASGTSVTLVEGDGNSSVYNGTATNTVFLLTVNADGSYNYTVTGNSVETASGTGVAGSIDLTGDRYFNAYAQPTGQYNYVKITAIPEPSSAALLGLGGLVLILRRRK